MSMTASDVFERYVGRVAVGEALTGEELHELAASPDIIPLGMLADTVRRRIHSRRVTYVRVAVCAFDTSLVDAVSPAAREVVITGHPDTLAVAEAAVRSGRAVAGSRTLCAFSWTDVVRLAGSERGVADVLSRFRDAGLDGLGTLPLDLMDDPEAVVGTLARCGYHRLRLTIEKASASARPDLFATASALHERFACIHAISPLPQATHTFKPTTGYEDVKMVALARLAAPNVQTVQVDWQRYGPKLAQVALTFGADDLYGVSASDDAPEGRRRAPVEEIKRNIEAAGFEPVERDGRFTAGA